MNLSVATSEISIVRGPTVIDRTVIMDRPLPEGILPDNTNAMMIVNKVGEFLLRKCPVVRGLVFQVHTLPISVCLQFYEAMATSTELESIEWVGVRYEDPRPYVVSEWMSIEPVAANLRAPGSSLSSLTLNSVDLRNDRAFAFFCDSISGTKTLFNLEISCCSVRSLSNLWTAMQHNESIVILQVCSRIRHNGIAGNINENNNGRTIRSNDRNIRPLNDPFGCHEFEQMLIHNDTLGTLQLGLLQFPTDFMALPLAIGRGMAINETLASLDLRTISFSSGQFQCLFDGGLSDNTTVEALGLFLPDKERAEVVASGLAAMARNGRASHVNGGRASLEHLNISRSPSGAAAVDQVVLECLITNQDALPIQDIYLWKVDTIETNTDDAIPAEYTDLIRTSQTLALLDFDGYNVAADPTTQEGVFMEFSKGMKLNRSMSHVCITQDNIEFDPLSRPNHAWVQYRCIHNDLNLSSLCDDESVNLLPHALARFLYVEEQDVDDDEEEEEEEQGDNEGGQNDNDYENDEDYDDCNYGYSQYCVTSEGVEDPRMDLTLAYDLIRNNPSLFDRFRRVQ